MAATDRRIDYARQKSIYSLVGLGYSQIGKILDNNTEGSHHETATKLKSDWEGIQRKGMRGEDFAPKIIPRIKTLLARHDELVNSLPPEQKFKFLLLNHHNTVIGKIR
ncbi:MAG: hypothetical protein V1835_00690 [Candidatus Micrarchaeota archaeon]